MWRSVGQNPFVDGKVTARITLSIGVSFFPSKNVINVEKLLENADQALYQAKHEGRDRICLFQHVNYLYRPHGMNA